MAETDTRTDGRTDGRTDQILSQRRIYKDCSYRRRSSRTRNAISSSSTNPTSSTSTNERTNEEGPVPRPPNTRPARTSSAHATSSTALLAQNQLYGGTYPSTASTRYGNQTNLPLQGADTTSCTEASRIRCTAGYWTSFTTSYGTGFRPTIARIQ
ncbi:hypothetical protein LSH36_326g01023 [Paralvinella palmiformis]|uniref:Uncharacterized protein n=1 Tax=Paralvinella palmiformis TaxID=53620 RepID=A0AAD9JGG0_9ANNE|nr:hypothetical protein LSH36_326g01023 [Paralvinella palmiformis]